MYICERAREYTCLCVFRRGVDEVKVCVIANLSVREFVYDVFCVLSCDFTTHRQYVLA